ncbi:hypothetical protein [Seonamhaeicola sp.]|uniref:hypothetical protein n=1 Tax=Seonamhaeicola sp. TaxID=1912245 RepID=UPI00263433C6|nr:hypothetical protein [Seonamhaeicola sp.]
MTVTPEGMVPAQGETNISWNRHIMQACLGAAAFTFLLGLVGLLFNSEKRYGFTGIGLSVLAIFYLLVKS